jgi:hypothetical protein
VLLKINIKVHFKYKWIKHLLIQVCLATCILLTSHAQYAPENTQAPKLEISMPTWSAARYEINKKREGLTFTSAEAAAASAAFKRIDPTYYIGYMLEGTTKANTAADYIGYSLAIAPLEKAMTLCEKDFKKQLACRTKDVMSFIQISELHRDFDYIAYQLYTCYSNIDSTAQAWNTVRRFQRYNFQDEQYMDSYNTLAWITHRNRFYTNEQLGFLKTNIIDNEKYAQQLLDSSAIKIKNDALYNSFYPEFVANRMSGIYHYKAILHTYSFNIDSANYYYNILKTKGYFSHNNYATFNSIQCKFKTALAEYKTAADQDAGDKRLQEHLYYSSMLNTYKGATKNSIIMCKDIIASNGSTPGYGWYNLALGRALIYDGQNQNALSYIDKAEQFKEVHIGTTLGQSHYDFTTSLLKLIAKENEIKTIKYLNKNWWRQFNLIGKIIALTIEKYTIQYFLINQFANNPERDNVVYKIFSTESTISFDEVWYLIKDFSTHFFIKKFEAQLLDDKRSLVKKYYQLFLAKLYLKQKDAGKALAMLNSIDIATIDAEHEKLFLARYYECKCWCDSKTDQSKYIGEIINNFPQIIPYSKLPMAIQIVSNANLNAEQKKIIENLNNSAFEIVNTNADLVVNINFSNAEKLKSATVDVISKNGITVTQSATFSYTDAKEASDIIAMSAFNIGNIKAEFNSGDTETKSK